MRDRAPLPALANGLVGYASCQVDAAFESNGHKWCLGNNVDRGEQHIDVNISVYIAAGDSRTLGVGMDSSVASVFSGAPIR